MEHPAQYVKELIDLAKKNGLKYLKSGEVELEFHEDPRPKTPSGLNLTDLSQDSEPTPTEDEMLYWSTEYSPENRVTDEGKQ